jgi:hypothetical protein
VKRSQFLGVVVLAFGLVTPACGGSEMTQVGPSCSYAVQPPTVSAPANGGSGILQVTAPSGCFWTATSGAAWITLTGSAGSGNGQVNYSVAVNSTAGTRAATITVASQTVTISQSAGTSQGNIVGNYTLEVQVSPSCPMPISTHRWPVTATFDGGTDPYRFSTVTLISDGRTYNWTMVYGYGQPPVSGISWTISTGGPGPGQVPGPITSDSGYVLAFSGRVDTQQDKTNVVPVINSAGRAEILNVAYSDSAYIWYNHPSGKEQYCEAASAQPGRIWLRAR